MSQNHQSSAFKMSWGTFWLGEEKQKAEKQLAKKQTKKTNKKQKEKRKEGKENKQKSKNSSLATDENQYSHTTS